MLELNRRAIYLFIFLALGLPLIFGYTVKPNRMVAAEKIYEIIENIDTKDKKIAFVAFDFGPNTIAENGSQAEVIVEHLMRRRIPFAVFAITPQSESFLQTIPQRIAKRLELEFPDQNWKYAEDWANLGYRPGGYLVVEGIPKASNPLEYLKRDVRGNDLKNLKVFSGVKTFADISLLAQFTGYVGVFDTYVQFFQNEQHKPILVHGCTSITIPEAYIYLDSGQLKGLLEGLSGAAWYSQLLKDKFPNRAPDNSSLMNTGLGVAQLVIVLLIIFGNISRFFSLN